MVASAVFPQLRQDGVSIDWTNAEYSAEISISGTSAVSCNSLSGAPEIEYLIASGRAQWALELRCPKTLFAKVVHSDSREVRCEWAPEDVDGEIFFGPGLIAIEDCVLDASGLNDAWGDHPVSIPAGRWIARGTAVRTESLASSLLTFHKKPQLRDGQMEVTADIGSGDLGFKVWLSPNYFERVIQSNRDVQIAALIAAFGQIPSIDDKGGEEFAILGHIKAALNEAGVPIWGDEGGEFDPALAATTIEPFYIPHAAEDGL